VRVGPARRAGAPPAGAQPARASTGRAARAHTAACAPPHDAPAADAARTRPSPPISPPKVLQQYLKVEGVSVKYIGPGQNDSQAAAVRADNPVPPDVPLYYFEVLVVNKGAEGYIGERPMGSNWPG
jgi:hypothetical protein